MVCPGRVQRDQDHIGPRWGGVHSMGRKPWLAHVNGGHGHADGAGGECRVESGPHVGFLMAMAERRSVLMQQDRKRLGTEASWCEGAAGHDRVSRLTDSTCQCRRVVTAREELRGPNCTGKHGDSLVSVHKSK